MKTVEEYANDIIHAKFNASFEERFHRPLTAGASTVIRQAILDTIEQCAKVITDKEGCECLDCRIIQKHIRALSAGVK